MFKINFLEKEFKFDELTNNILFENIKLGRDAATLADFSKSAEGVVSVPLVRTTTIYQNPTQDFTDVYHELIEEICYTFNDISDNLKFNNIMVEIYDSRYKKMGFHTDQALDLATDSFICIYSCYDTSNEELNKKANKSDGVATLTVKRKKIDDKPKEIKLENNSAVLFSTTDNKRHLHKLDFLLMPLGVKWLGITLRFSKTHIHFINEIPYFIQNDEQYGKEKPKELRLANKDEMHNYFRCKHTENITTNYVYPRINYTVSLGDLFL